MPARKAQRGLSRVSLKIAHLIHPCHFSMWTLTDTLSTKILCNPHQPALQKVQQLRHAPKPRLDRAFKTLEVVVWSAVELVPGKGPTAGHPNRM